MAKIWPDADGPWSDPGSDGGNLKINEFLTFHLIRLASIAKASVDRVYLDPAGLSVPEWRLLATVANYSPLPFADITAMTTMDKGQVSRTLRSAQAKGLVETELVPADRRGNGEGGSTSISRVMVSITPAGLELYGKVMPVAQNYQAGLLRLMTVEERRLLLDVLQRVHGYLIAGAIRE
ncbi:MAG TPA: MarR family winged helix-turn-helix transcriptional regulator [Steroidobacteraceae bacterium]|nr:MarR family winged helix-turn-helix transcriptional regulator [Steroidobacteraceae bacterium]